MKRLLKYYMIIIFVLPFLLQSIFAIEDLQIVKFNFISSNSIKCIEFLNPRAKPIEDRNRFKEKIINFPQNYKIKATYQFKEAQRSFKYILDNESYKEDYLKEFGEESFNFILRMNSQEPFDCVISACLVVDNE